MDELKFKVSVELKNILGRDLITSDNIAILELVKNSYDAHATKVEITFNEDEIIIADNGKGMTLDELKNKWLFVGYSAKRDGTEDNSYRSKFKKNYAGAKGIGRISCDRLARYVTLTTKSEESNNVEKLIVDWNSFEQNQRMEFDTVAVEHSSFAKDYNFPSGSHHGTVISLTALHGSWGKDEILGLRKSLEKMINPFSGTDDYKIEIFAPAFSNQDENIKREIEERLATTDKLNDYEQHEITKLDKSIVGGIIENSINDVLKIKTTQIESTLKDGIIRTTLSDRGEVMYETEEINKYPLLEDVTVNLYYLNRAAKYNFSMKMGVQPVQYGNVFLFRNGFRIWPYGEYNDDSWGLNQRAQQGYNRTLGTRDLFGRVDVETNKVDDFNEVSSRDGGLIMTKHAQQLFDFFTLIHRRLERYVVGVLWGVGFIKNNYFQNIDLATKAREKLNEHDKDLDNTDSVFENLGSKVDFLQLVKSMVNDKSLHVKYYNAKLADVVSDVSASDIIHANVFNDLRKVAEKTNDLKLASDIEFFEKQIAKMRKEKEEADRKAEIAIQKAEDEERKLKVVEHKLEQKNKQNLFLQSIGSLDVDRILKYHHDIRLQASTIENSLKKISKMLKRESINTEELASSIGLIARANSKIITIAQFATKANFNLTGDYLNDDLVNYVYQYVTQVIPEFYNDIKLNCITHSLVYYFKFKPLEISLIIDNLLSNSIKASSKNFFIEFAQEERFEMHIYDDGHGISKIFDSPNSVFEKGVTSTNGSGLGLYNVQYFLNKEYSASIKVDVSYRSSREGYPGCKLIITF